MAENDSLTINPYVEGDWEAAVQWINRAQQLHEALNSVKNQALYAQATKGEAPLSAGLWLAGWREEPPFWGEWNKLRGLGREEAMEKYIDAVTAVSPHWRLAEKKIAEVED